MTHVRMTVPDRTEFTHLRLKHVRNRLSLWRCRARLSPCSHGEEKCRRQCIHVCFDHVLWTWAACAAHLQLGHTAMHERFYPSSTWRCFEAVKHCFVHVFLQASPLHGQTFPSELTLTRPRCLVCYIFQTWLCHQSTPSCCTCTSAGTLS